MQFNLLIPLTLGFAASVLVTLYQSPATAMPAEPMLVQDANDADLNFNIEHYDDEYYGFSLAIPAGWIKVMAEQSAEDLAMLEPGYSIGFEAPIEGIDDAFSDYIMIEILPGNDSGAFETDGSNRLNVLIDDRPAWIDELSVNASIYGLDDIELTVYQAQSTGLGFTVGLYAIGEPGRAKMMATAFELMVRTFSFYVEPYSTV